MAETDLMTLLFGKKRRRRVAGGRRRKGRKVTRLGVKKPKGLTAVIKKAAKKYKVRIMMKNGKYRKLSTIKKEIRRKKRAAMKKQKSKMKRHGSGVKRRRRRRRRSSFGVGGSYMPLSSFMSPYPYSVDSSPPYI